MGNIMENTNNFLPEDFLDYKGIRKKPEDFDLFWEARRKEADLIPLDYEISPCRIVDRSTCVFRELRFKGIKDETIFCKYLRPNTDEDVPLTLEFHGYEGSGRSYLEQCSYVALGHALIVPDCPGQGGYSEDKGGYAGPTVVGHVTAGVDGDIKDAYYVRWFQNLRILTRIAMELEGIDTDNITVAGGSQGAAQAIAAAALSPEVIKKAALLYPFLSDFDYIYEIDTDSVTYKDIRYYATWFDPCDTRGRDWLGKMAYYDTKNMATLVKCPVLFGMSLADEMCPPKSQAATYNNLSCPKELHTYPGMGHVEIQEFDDLLIGFLDDASGAKYSEEHLHINDTDVTARIIRPSGEGKHPVCFYFTDCNRGMRGWHWLNRFSSLGLAVVCMDNGLEYKDNFWEYSGEELTGVYERTKALVSYISGLDWVDEGNISLTGDGLGSTLAIVAGAHLDRPVKIAAYVPVMADIDTVLSEEKVSKTDIPSTLDICKLAENLQGSVLLGTGMKDRESYVNAQMKLARILKDKVDLFEHKKYVRCGHDRNNFFENEMINWI